MAYTGRRPGPSQSELYESGGALENHDLLTVDVTGSITNLPTALTFYKADSTSDTIAITSGTFPFYKADGSSDTIGVS